MRGAVLPSSLAHDQDARQLFKAPVTTFDQNSPRNRKLTRSKRSLVCLCTPCTDSYMHLRALSSVRLLLPWTSVPPHDDSVFAGHLAPKYDQHTSSHPLSERSSVPAGVAYASLLPKYLPLYGTQSRLVQLECCIAPPLARNHANTRAMREAFVRTNCHLCLCVESSYRWRRAVSVASVLPKTSLSVG